MYVYVRKYMRDATLPYTYLHNGCEAEVGFFFI